MSTDFASTIAPANTPVRGTYLSATLYDEVMHELPIPTADVLILSADLSRTLLFNRTNKPVQHVYYSIGGRVFKNEHLRDAAMRKLKKELPMLGAMVSAANLVLAGVMEEIFSDSMFNATNSHCINSVFALVLPQGRALEAALLAARHDSQASRAKWFDVDDRAHLHPYMREKLRLLSHQAPTLAERSCAPHAVNETACMDHMFFQPGGAAVHCEWEQSDARCVPPPPIASHTLRSSCAGDSPPSAAPGSMSSRHADAEATPFSMWKHGGLDRSESPLLLAEGAPMRWGMNLQSSPTAAVAFLLAALLVLSVTARFLWRERRALAQGAPSTSFTELSKS